MNQRYCNGMIHVIKQGDNLYQLSRKYRVPLALILRANPYVDVYNLQPGQEICIPVARPYPGMMTPPFCVRPPHRQEPDMPMEPEDEMEMSESEPEEISGEEQLENAEDGKWEEEEEERDRKGEYVCEGNRSLGDILREQDMTVSDFMESNSPDSLILAEGTRLYLIKKV
ncbi:MAG: LysM domain-containing protein [Eubacterium sp.]|nr:LysM domain-containing protein [Eubacterium sp.]